MGALSQMWIIMLVMMVFTRTRLDENSQLPAYQPVPEGIASAGTKRRRNHKSRKSKLEQVFVEEETAAEQPAAAQPAAAQPAAAQPAAAQPAAAQPGAAEIACAEQPGAGIPDAQQHAGPTKRRGPNINHTVARTLHNLPDGAKIPLTMDKDTKTFVGASATNFATECGIVIRNVCPMNFHTWDSVPKEVKTLMIEKLEGSFELLRGDNVFMEYVDARLRAQWKRTRGVLSEHWKKNGGKTNPLVARSNMKPGCRSEEDWNHLCNYWELEKTRKYSDKMEANRAKQVNISRGGSRSISNHVFQMENIIEHKKAAVDKLTLEGTVITTAIEHNIEKEAIKSVCGKQKTMQSAWQVGVGPVLRKKDSWMNTSVQSSYQDSSQTNEDLKNQVIALKKELEHSNDKYQRMSEFISTKFPEFENIISTTVTVEAHDSEGLSGDSYHTT